MIRVLVVDDLKLIHEGLKAMFADDDEIVIVECVENGKEAIEYVKNSNPKPNIVLTDVVMPVMGGIETTAEISKLFPEVKVIVLSGSERDPSILKAIAAGAKGYLLKNTIAQDLASAICAVDRGYSHFSPGIIESIAETARKEDRVSSTKALPPSACPIDSPQNKVQQKSNKTKVKNSKKAKPQKPLFENGDWLTIILCVIVLSQTDGMGHHLAHAGLFFLMLSLLARPIKNWWNWPLKHRRAIGIFAFAAALSHAFYATFKVLDFDFEMVMAMSAKNQWGIVIGIISLLLMTPAAVTSFQYFQKKLGKKWRQIHLLTVPSLAFAVLHTVISGPHYMATSGMDAIDYLRVFGVAIGGILVLLMRRKIFWSTLGLDKLGKKGKKLLNQEKQVSTIKKTTLSKNKKDLIET